MNNKSVELFMNAGHFAYKIKYSSREQQFPKYSHWTKISLHECLLAMNIKEQEHDLEKQLCRTETNVHLTLFL